MHAVLSLTEKVDISVGGFSINVKLTYAEGMIGAIPVFDTKEEAEKYASGKYEIIEISTKKVQ